MSQQLQSTTLQEYQDAMRALEQAERQQADVLTLIEARRRLHAATEAWEAEKKILTDSQRVKLATQGALRERLERAVSPPCARCNRPFSRQEALAGYTVCEYCEADPQYKLAVVKQQLKAAGQTLKGLRGRNKELHAELQENIAEKKRINYDVVPKLRAKKKELVQVIMNRIDASSHGLPEND